MVLILEDWHPGQIHIYPDADELFFWQASSLLLSTLRDTSSGHVSMLMDLLLDMLKIWRGVEIAEFESGANGRAYLNVFYKDRGENFKTGCLP